MDNNRALLQKWLAQVKRWPKWAWGTAVLACIVLIALLVNPDQYASSSTPTADPLQSPTGLAINIFLKFSVVLGLIYLAYYLLRRWQVNRVGLNARQLAIKETIHLSPRRSIHLIQAGNRILLVGATDQAVSFLAEIDPSLNEQSVPTAVQAVDFATLLAKSPFGQNNQ